MLIVLIEKNHQGHVGVSMKNLKIYGDFSKHQGYLVDKMKTWE